MTIPTHDAGPYRDPSTGRAFLDTKAHPEVYIIPAIVKSVDVYATKVAPNQSVPSGYDIVAYLLWQIGEGKKPAGEFPGELVEYIEAIILRITDTDYESDAYAGNLHELAEMMDDSEENAND